ncbi:MAG: DUF6796 family protein [Pseudomonadota bacterium]
MTNPAEAFIQPRTLVTLACVGLLGPLTMFAGDMLLYYTSVSSEYFDSHIAEIMSDMPFARLALGGLFGPIAAVLYMASFLVIVLFIDPDCRRSRIGIFVLFACMMTVGGAYHALFPLFAFHADAVLAGALPEAEHFPAVGALSAAYLNTLSAAYIGCGCAAWIWLAVLVFRGRTLLPRWSLLLTPVLWIPLGELFLALPQPLNVIFAGGWFNLAYLPMFALLVKVALGNASALFTRSTGVA